MSLAHPDTQGAAVAAESLIPASRLARLILPAVALWLALHTPSVCVPHDEIDEHVYRALARSLARGDGYTTRGTSIHPLLDPEVYDHPLSHHPPLGAVLLIPFAHDPSRGVVIGWLAHLLLLAAVLDLARRRLPATPAGERALALALALAAADPILVFAANRIWIDVPAAGLSAMGIALFDRWLCTRGRAAWWGSAALCALALWTKLPALLAGGAVVVLAATHLQRQTDPLERLAIVRGTALWAALVALAILPWFLVFHAVYGVWLPTWSRPSAALVASNAHVAAAAALPHHYSATETATIHPILAAVPLLLLLARARPTALVALAWLGGTLGGLVLLASTGNTSQLRYAAIATAPLHLVAALALAELGARRARLALGLGLALLAHALALDAVLLARPHMSKLHALWRYF